jgi:hypothetical protein
MNGHWRRLAIAALWGAVAGPLALIGAVRGAPDLDLDLDRQVPGFITGFYGPERHERETFAWTSGEATLVLDGADRRVPWHCVIRLRGGRPDAADTPMVEIALDGARALMRPAPAAYQDFTVPVPASDTRRITVTISSDVFNPGPADPRPLGVQVEHIRCAPAGPVLPPRAAIVEAALPPAVLGAALGAGGLGLTAVGPLVLVIAILQALVLAMPSSLYSGFSADAAWLAAAIAAGALLLQRAAERVTGRPWHPAARLALGVSVAALYLKLAALLQPAKAIVDAVFHAHRLEWVLEGRLLFTQPIQDAVLFPYAIGLYVFAAPWTLVTDHHVALLRVIVTTVETLGGGLLYVMTSRYWQDRRAGVLAVTLFHFVPIAYAVVGNANLTNAFGQEAALVAIAAATMWRLDWRHASRLVGLTALVALALLSHVSTLAMLTVTLGAAGAFGLWPRVRTFGVPAVPLLGVTLAAVVLAVALYYGHFGEVYATAGNAGAPMDAAASGTFGEPMSLGRRVGRALYQGVLDVSWPIALLALVGLWRLIAERRGDRLTATLIGWGVMYALFTAAGALSPVNARYERYALEFISRVNLAIYPAVVVVAGRGASWLLARGVAGRMAAAGLLCGAAAVGFRVWLRWLS